MKIVLDEHAIMPTRAHDTDAGLDLYTPIAVDVPAHGSAIIDTGVHVELPRYPLTVGLLTSKSGLNVKHDITGEGTIDVGYTGSIRVKLYNNGDKDYHFEEGHKVIQLVIMPILVPTLELVDSLGETERADNGFGSSGK